MVTKVRKMTTEDLYESIQLVKRYESYRVLKLWGISLIIIPIVNLFHMLMFEAWTDYGRVAEYIYPGLLGAAIIVFTIYFIFSFRSTKRLEIKDKKIVSRYYVKLALAVFFVFFFFAILFMIAELLEIKMPVSAYKMFPAILGGTVLNIKGYFIQIYWGDNLALLIGYLLLRNEKQGIKLIELPITIVILTILDILVVSLNPFIANPPGMVVQLLDEYLVYIFSIFSLICGIISLVKAYKFLKRKDILDTK
jgi:hypothetical protein